MPIFFIFVLCTFIYIQGLSEEKTRPQYERQKTHMEACTKGDKVREWSSWKGRNIWVYPECNDMNGTHDTIINQYPKPPM